MCDHTHCARHGVAFEGVEEFIARRASALAIAVDLGGRGEVMLENFGCIFGRFILIQGGQNCGNVALASLRRLG